MPSKERLGYAVVGSLLLFGMGVVGARNLHPSSPIVFEGKDPRSAPSGAPSVSASGDFVVHVIGAVRNPGVFHLPAGSRITDAVHAAGDGTSDADLESVNLAAAVTDGQQITVASRNADLHEGGEPALTGPVPVRPDVGSVPRSMPRTAMAAPQTSTSRKGKGTRAPASRGKKAPPTSPISLNSATAEQLQTLPGVGPATAEKILAYRQEHGKFATIDELIAVKGIGPKKMEALRPFLRL